jgi:hypothetical protein
MNFQKLILEYNPNTPAVAVDFETYYDDDCSVSSLTYWHYTRHPKFDAFMVSIYSPFFGISFVGHPLDFDWSQIDGMIWLAHNSPFDRAVHDRLAETTVSHSIGTAKPHAWVNTADLATYMHAPRSLAGASKVLLDRKMSKQVRTDMKGRKFSSLPDDEKKAWLDYAMDDAVNCYDIWEKYGSEWPRTEQLLSLHTSECVKRGVCVDLDKVTQSVELLKKAVDAAERQIPWAGEQETTPKGNLRFYKDGTPRIVSPTSPRKLAVYARECGIPLPTTTEAKSEEFQLWEKTYGKRFPVIGAVQTWRKTNRLLRVFEQILSRIRDDGRMELQICYFGAHATGRWSGRPGGGAREGEDEKGLNIQNLPKDTLYFDDNYMLADEGAYSVDVRSCFVADKGKTFVIADLSQIEPRVLSWLVGDEAFLEQVRSGISPYEAHARTSMGWTGGNLKVEDKDQYAFSKARLLSLGYGAGWQKFISMAAMYVGEEVFTKIFTQPVSEEQVKDFLKYLKVIRRDDLITSYQGLDETTQRVWVNSWVQVTDFRSTNPRITAFWDMLQRQFTIAATRKEDYFITLPSGRKLGYYEPRKYDKKATRYIGGSRSGIYGGLLGENCTQATARDVFGEGIIRLEEAGYPVVFHVHDEVICEVPEGTDPDPVVALLAQPPTWMDDLPVGAEGEVSPYYKK